MSATPDNLKANDAARRSFAALRLGGSVRSASEGSRSPVKKNANEDGAAAAKWTRGRRKRSDAEIVAQIEGRITALKSEIRRRSGKLFAGGKAYENQGDESPSDRIGKIETTAHARQTRNQPTHTR